MVSLLGAQIVPQKPCNIADYEIRDTQNAQKVCREFCDNLILTYLLKVRKALPLRCFSASAHPKCAQPLSCFKIDGLKFAQKPTQKSRNFIPKRIKNQFKKLKRKTAVFFNFRLLDYLSSALTVGYTIFDELCRYYFAVRFQKIFE